VTRLLIVVALIAFVLLVSRRVFSSGRRPSGGRPGRDLQGRPERLVCGHCGAEFDAEASGWTCPKCGR
jgi:hypothetical protein